jgi:hypothetical protein
MNMQNIILRILFIDKIKKTKKKPPVWILDFFPFRTIKHYMRNSEVYKGIRIVVFDQN